MRMYSNNTHSRKGGRPGGGGGVARMNAQKLIKDRVVCPAGAWYPGDLTTRPPIHPLSLPPLTRSPRSPPYHRSHTLSSICVSDDVSTAWM